MLSPGVRFLQDGHEYQVIHVNESRAHCVRTETRKVSVYDGKRGGMKTFTAKSTRVLNISPNSLVDTVAGEGGTA